MARNTSIPLQVIHGTHDKLSPTVLKTGELAFDTTEKRITAGDGVTTGGVPHVTLAEFYTGLNDIRSRKLKSGTDGLLLNGADSADLSSDIVISLSGDFGGGGSNIIVVSIPTFALPEKVSNLNAATTFSATANAMLEGIAVDSFLLTIPELGVNKQQFKAVSDSATLSFTVPRSVAAGTTLHVSVQAQDGLGNLSLVATQTTAVATVSVNAPTITIPASGEKVMVAGGVNVSLTAFSITGDILDAHSSTDWQLASDSSFSNIVEQAMDSADLVQHTFAGTALTNGNTYYLRARMKGAASGASPWSGTVSFEAISVVISAEGRGAYLHESGKLAMVYDNFGVQATLLVGTAADRFQAALTKGTTATDGYNVDIPGLTNRDGTNAAGTRYINNGNATMTTAQAKTLTEAQLNQYWPANKVDDHTAKYNTDIWLGYQSPAAIKTRQIIWNGQGFDIPNVQQCIRLYCMAPELDALDNTLSSYPNQGLTNWFNNGYMWTSTEYSAARALVVDYYGGVTNLAKNYTNYWVVPVLELI